MLDITPQNDIIPIRDSVVSPNDGLIEKVGGTSGLGGRLAGTIVGAIDSSGDFVNDLVNARLDTSAKTILDAFTFGTSGALQIGTYVNGVSGDIRISPNGIVARNSAGTNTIAVDGTTGGVTIVGTITASAGSIGGWTIQPTYIAYDGATDAQSAGMSATDYPFYAGKKYADRSTAPFRVLPTGVMYATGAVIDGTTTIGGRLCSTVAGAINAVGELITSNLDTSTKTILSDFTFGVSGAIQIGTYSAGVSGDIKLSPNGILGRDKNNATTFSIDATTGNATFAGSLSAASGTLGTITAGDINGVTITGGTVQTASSGKRIVISSNVAEFYNAGGTNVASLNGGTLGSTDFLRIESPSAAAFNPIFINQKGANSQGSIYIQNEDNGAGARCVELYQKGDKSALWIKHDSTSSGKAIDIEYSGTAASALSVVTTSSVPVSSVYVDQSNGDGYCAELKGGSGANQTLYADKNKNDVPVANFKQSSATSTNFWKVQRFTGGTEYNEIWIGNGNTPNGALSGRAGDILLGGDGGKAYYCTGTTNWTAM